MSKINSQAGFTLVELIQALFILVVVIGGGGLLIYALVHFIAKFW